MKWLQQTSQKYPVNNNKVQVDKLQSKNRILGAESVMKEKVIQQNDYKTREISLSQTVKDHNLLKKVKIKKKEQEQRPSLQEPVTSCSTSKVQQPLSPWKTGLSLPCFGTFAMNNHSNTASRKGQRQLQFMLCTFARLLSS